MSRSNLSRINDGKPHTLYEALFGRRLICRQGVVPGHDFCFKNPLYSLDVSTLGFPKGHIVAVDKGYNDYAWYKQLTDKGSIFCYPTQNQRNIPHSQPSTCIRKPEFDLRSNHRVHCYSNGKEVPRSVTSHRVSGCRNRKALCFPDQQLPRYQPKPLPIFTRQDGRLSYILNGSNNT